MEREGSFGKVVVVVLALAVLATLVDAAVSRRRPEPERRLLSVTSEGYVEAEPDVARISLGVKAVRPTPKAAADEVAETMRSIKAKLTALGVQQDAVETSELYLGEASEYDYTKGRTVRLGYKAYHWLRVTLKRDDFAKLAPVIDGSVAAGATSFAGLSFEMEDDTALRAQALAKAASQARQKAEAMAAAAKARIAGVHSLFETYPGAWPGWRSAAYEYEAGVTDRAAAAGRAAAEAPAPAPAAPAEAPAGEPEVPGKLRVSCQVEVAFLLQ